MRVVASVRPPSVFESVSRLSIHRVVHPPTYPPTPSFRPSSAFHSLLPPSFLASTSCYYHVIDTILEQKQECTVSQEVELVGWPSPSITHQRRRARDGTAGQRTSRPTTDNKHCNTADVLTHSLTHSQSVSQSVSQSE